MTTVYSTVTFKVKYFLLFRKNDVTFKIMLADNYRNYIIATVQNLFTNHSILLLM